MTLSTACQTQQLLRNEGCCSYARHIQTGHLKQRRFGIGKINSYCLRHGLHPFGPRIQVFFFPDYQDFRRSFNPQTDLLSTDFHDINFYVVSNNHSLAYLSRKD
jgi:hypothetical protein